MKVGIQRSEHGDEDADFTHSLRGEIQLTFLALQHRTAEPATPVGAPLSPLRSRFRPPEAKLTHYPRLGKVDGLVYTVPMADQDDVRWIALALPGAREGKDRFAFSVEDEGKRKGFAWAWNEA